MDCINCSICGEPNELKLTHELNCGHVFHYNCLLLSFRNMQTDRCPYCRKSGNKLPLVNGLKKIYYDIHDTKDIDTYVNIKCKHILKKGKNKGKTCSKYCLLGEEFCSIHLEKNKNKNKNKTEDK